MKLLPLSIITLLAAALSSCVPPISSVPPSASSPQSALGSEAENQAKDLTGDQKRELEEMRERLLAQNTPNTSGVGSGESNVSLTTPNSSTGSSSMKSTKPTTYPYATPVPGKDGFVFNPYTNNRVDVRDIPRGTLVRDPHDANANHKFRVP